MHHSLHEYFCYAFLFLLFCNCWDILSNHKASKAKIHYKWYYSNRKYFMSYPNSIFLGVGWFWLILVDSIHNPSSIFYLKANLKGTLPIQVPTLYLSIIFLSSIPVLILYEFLFLAHFSWSKLIIILSFYLSTAF